MAEICTTIITILGLVDVPAKIKQHVLDPIKAQFSYLSRYNNIIQSLRHEKERLNARTNNLQEQIQAHERNNRIILPQVDEWLSEVDKLKEEIDNILSHEPGDGTCLQRTCPNLKVRYSHSRKAMGLIARIVELTRACDNFGSTISNPVPGTRMKTISETSSTQFDSREAKEEEIMRLLRDLDSSIYMIGIWGMGGVGKTTMVKKIGKRATDKKLFDDVPCVAVGQPVNLLEIQQKLAECLDLHLEEKTVRARAEQLHYRMENKKVLVILDDVWQPLNLEELGIPSQTKILLTTRDHGVCQRMSIQKATHILTLEVLKEDEAISLFCKTVGKVADNLRPLAENVAKECKGLPLALVVVGSSLIGVNNESIWQASLGQLQKSAPEYIGGYLQGVYGPLKLSYDRLESDEDKYLFLLCCLFPEDSKIEIINLVHYGVGLHIFSAISISEAREKVNLIVRKLVARCLLMDAGDESSHTYVKMHDVIRDMALSIASRGEHKFMVSHDEGLREWPRESYTCISLTLGEAMTFQEGMHCQGLKALLLTIDLSTTMLPQNFLNGMADLTLLSIHGQHRWQVFRLPLSFLSSETKLRVLHLHQCGLEDTDVSLLGQVKDLEILSCRGSDIQKLPNEIRALRKLKLLDLTYCRKLKNIAPDVFPALVKLEELRLMGCPIEWERQETGDERRNASLAEVFSLKNLRVLEIWIKDLEVISQEINYSLKLTSYSIAIGGDGDAIDMEGSHTNLKRMSVYVDERRVFPDVISKLIEDVEEVKLKGNGCKGIIELLGRRGFENIRSLKIDGLGDVKFLVEPTMPGVIFPFIRHLKLSNMNDLEEICNGHPPRRPFFELKEIAIESCAKLKCVFPLSIAGSLSKLESLVVWNCPVVEEVFNKSESGITTVNHVKFPNLKKMVLHNLPRLGAWCKTVDAVIEFPSIQRLMITEVSPNFKVFGNLQLTQVTCTKLRELTISNLGVEIFYSEIQPIGFFSGLERLHIKSLHGLRTLFSRTAFRALSNLWGLTVVDCTMLEEIIEMKKDEDEGDRNNIIQLSSLKELRLSNLPKIRYFGHFSNTLELPSLENVKIVNCPKMGAFVEDELCCSTSMSSGSITARNFFNKQVSCTKLREFTISHLGVEIFYREVLPIDFISGLEMLHITSFHSLRVLFSQTVFRALSNLWKLTVEDCTMLEEIIEMKKDEDEGDRNNISKLSRLSCLQLSNLPKIRYFGHFNNALELSSLTSVNIVNCPKMETLVEDELWCSSGMSSGSIPARNFFNKQVTCTQLWELHINSCHGLRTLFSWTVFRGLSNLCELTVEDCTILEEIIEMKKDENNGDRNNISKLSRLRELRLLNLPKIHYFGHFSNTLELPSLEKVIIVNCPKMEAFVEDELWCSTSMSSGSIPAKNFFNKQVTCPKLSLLRLHGLNISGLLVENCSLFEEVIVKDENEDVDEMVVSLPKLVYLYLIDLPKLRGFSHTRRDLELTQLTNISLSGCTEIINNSFCLGGGSVRMASGVEVKGISDPKIASQCFFPTQKSLEIMQHAPEEDSLDNGCFMLFESDISFTWDSGREPSVVKGTSNAFFLHGWKKACGTFDMEKLSSEITYQIAFVIMLFKSRKENDDQLETMLEDEKREHTVKHMPKQEWVEMLVGELRPLSGQRGDITFSLQKKYDTTRVALKCASIRPKRIATDAM